MAEFVHIEDSVKDAILTIMRYVKGITGVEPTQDEIAEMLKSYFILNEVGNQVKYQLKNEAEKAEEDQIDSRKPVWTLNLKAGPGKNVLARAGVFHKSIPEALQVVNDFMLKTIGTVPSAEILSRSLKSSFILSEIKNQINWQRKEASKGDQKILIPRLNQTASTFNRFLAFIDISSPGTCHANAILVILDQFYSERKQLMNQKITSDTWIWVIVQDPGGDEQFLGQHDEKKNVSFIPAFYEKDDAQQSLIQLITEKGKKYEVQAIFFDELAKDAAQHGFMIFMLNADGEILEEIAPNYS